MNFDVKRKAIFATSLRRLLGKVTRSYQPCEFHSDHDAAAAEAESAVAAEANDSGVLYIGIYKAGHLFDLSSPGAFQDTVTLP